MYPKEGYGRGDISKLFEEMGKNKDISGQIQVPRLLAYTNSILNTMYDYLADRILEHKLHFEYRDDLAADRTPFKLNGSSHGGARGLDARTFYLMKYVYSRDKRYAHEHTERWDDFAEELLISPHKVFDM
jgi:hypothetical protein